MIDKMSQGRLQESELRCGPRSTPPKSATHWRDCLRTSGTTRYYPKEYGHLNDAKVTGAKLLHEHFSSPVDNPLDFFVMCSSAATTGGNPGQANYNAANAFLLAFAQKRRLMGLAVSDGSLRTYHEQRRD